MPKGKRSRPQKPASRKRRPSLLSRLASPFKRLLGLGRKPRKGKPSARAALLPGGGQKRTLAQWKELRRRTTAEVKAHLAEQQPVPAIKKLTRALLEDPQHPAYHELLKKAVEQRRQRRIKAGRKDPWAELPKDLKQEALQLEAFSAYVDELEQLFDKAGIPPLSAPPPPEERQARKGKAKAAKGKGLKPAA
ncbi:MAG: hypothetical protein FJ054_09715 [Cyanobacteria bacterium M_surface_10_m2_119]|nr:hypothetical protein [Cyanobacteria bacterium M_surface_10_m2_119]